MGCGVLGCIYIPSFNSRQRRWVGVSILFLFLFLFFLLIFIMVVDKHEHFWKLQIPFLGFLRGSSRIRWCLEIKNCEAAHMVKLPRLFLLPPFLNSKFHTSTFVKPSFLEMTKLFLFFLFFSWGSKTLDPLWPGSSLMQCHHYLSLEAELREPCSLWPLLEKNIKPYRTIDERHVSLIWL